MGCAASAQVRPGGSAGRASGEFRDDDGAYDIGHPAASTSGRDDGALVATTVATVSCAHPDDPRTPTKRRANFGASPGHAVDADSPPVPMSPEPVTEGLFGGTKKTPEPTPPPAASSGAASVSAPAPAASSPPPSKAPPKKKLTAAQQNEEDRATLHRKLQEAEALMIKATEKSIALATIEESMLRLQKLVLVERDGRRVAEVEAEEANRSLQRAEEKLKREMEERHVMQLRVTAAQELAGEAEDKYRELKMLDRTKEKVAAESFNGGDRSEHEKILEQDLANARRELAEALAAEKEARAIKELDARTAEERPRIDEDLERVKVERRIKEAVQMALAKHEREASKALMKASEDKVRALEVASVQKRQALEVQKRNHEEELRRAEERGAREAEAAREDMRPARWEFEKLQQERLDDQKQHAEDRRVALEDAAAEYAAAIEKLKISHAYELGTLRRANEERVATYSKEAARSETKTAIALEQLTLDLKDAQRKLERETERRAAAEKHAASDAEARREAEEELVRLRADRAAAMDLVSASRRARDTAERRTKETYLEIERAKRAGDKRSFFTGDGAENPNLGGRPSTADRELAELPEKLGLTFRDELERRVADARAEVHDATAPCAAAELDVAKYRKECDARKATPDADIMERLAAEAYKRRAALDAASGTLAAALAELRERREKELAEIEDEARALEVRKEEKNAKANIARAGAGAGGVNDGSSDGSSSDDSSDEKENEPQKVSSSAGGKGKRAVVEHTVQKDLREARRGEARFEGKGAKYRHRSMEEEDEPRERQPARPPFKFTPLDL